MTIFENNIYLLVQISNQRSAFSRCFELVGTVNRNIGKLKLKDCVVLFRRSGWLVLDFFVLQINYLCIFWVLFQLRVRDAGMLDYLSVGVSPLVSQESYAMMEEGVFHQCLKESFFPNKGPWITSHTKTVFRLWNLYLVKG